MRENLQQKISKIVRELFDINVSIELTRPDEQFGDYSTNIAMQLAGRMNNPPAGGPREIAENITRALKSMPEITDVSVAGPGFINITLADYALAELSSSQLKQTDGEVVIETNNPNPFKAMHIGHAFNAIIADTIANLLEFSGRTTHRVSYHGDVGQHVGRSMYSLLRYVDGNPEKLNEIPVVERNSFMSRMYAEGSKAYKEDERAKAEINSLAAQSFTLNDPVYKAVYETCKDWSFQQIDELVARMGNKPIERRYLESQADALGVETVKNHAPDVFIESDGAYVFPGSKHGSFDNVFVSSNGRGLYGARDLGLIQLKHRDFPRAEKSYIVTAEEQRDYFKGVTAAAGLVLPELKDLTINIPTGTVKLSTGKMSSRSGDVLEIGWLFDQITEAVKANGANADESVIAGALRYEFLRVRVGGDVIFNVEEAVSIKGNSGPYLQYALARARSILSKAAVESASIAEGALEPGERTLLRKIGQFTETVELAAQELMPHHICTYLYELAQTFNHFYEHNRVIGDEREAVRLKLVELYADKLKAGLELLGINAPDHM